MTIINCISSDKPKCQHFDLAHLNPRHVLQLHLLHLLLHHRVELVLKLQRLDVVHVPAQHKLQLPRTE